MPIWKDEKKEKNDGEKVRPVFLSDGRMYGKSRMGREAVILPRDYKSLHRLLAAAYDEGFNKSLACGPWFFIRSCESSRNWFSLYCSQDDSGPALQIGWCTEQGRFMFCCLNGLNKNGMIEIGRALNNYAFVSVSWPESFPCAPHMTGNSLKAKDIVLGEEKKICNIEGDWASFDHVMKVRLLKNADSSCAKYKAEFYVICNGVQVYHESSYFKMHEKSRVKDFILGCSNKMRCTAEMEMHRRNTVYGKNETASCGSSPLPRYSSFQQAGTALTAEQGSGTEEGSRGQEEGEGDQLDWRNISIWKSGENAEKKLRPLTNEDRIMRKRSPTRVFIRPDNFFDLRKLFSESYKEGLQRGLACGPWNIELGREEGMFWFNLYYRYSDTEAACIGRCSERSMFLFWKDTGMPLDAMIEIGRALKYINAAASWPDAFGKPPKISGRELRKVGILEDGWHHFMTYDGTWSSFSYFGKVQKLEEWDASMPRFCSTFSIRCGNDEIFRRSSWFMGGQEKMAANFLSKTANKFHSGAQLEILRREALGIVVGNTHLHPKADK